MIYNGYKGEGWKMLTQNQKTIIDCVNAQVIRDDRVYCWFLQPHPLLFKTNN